MNIFLSNTGDLKISEEQPEGYMTLEEWRALTPPAAITLDEQHRIANGIKEWQDYLASTDYISLKIADGAAIREEYAQELVKRQCARTAINVLQMQLIDMVKTQVEG